MLLFSIGSMLTSTGNKAAKTQILFVNIQAYRSVTELFVKLDKGGMQKNRYLYSQSLIFRLCTVNCHATCLSVYPGKQGKENTPKH